LTRHSGAGNAVGVDTEAAVDSFEDWAVVVVAVCDGAFAVVGAGNGVEVNVSLDNPYQYWGASDDAPRVHESGPVEDGSHDAKADNSLVGGRCGETVDGAADGAAVAAAWQQTGADDVHDVAGEGHCHH
jgi:hypothetical protein